MRLLGITKVHLFRAINKEYGFTKDKLSKMKLTDVLTLFYPFVLKLK